METFLQPKEETPRNTKAIIAGIGIGVVLIAVAAWVLMQQPTAQEQITQVLEGSYREGSPEFTEITKDIIISTDDNTVESPNAFGSISMFISGRIRNKGNRVINGLEVNVAVVDRFNQVLKEKRVLVVPRQQAQLAPGEIIPITLSLEGFNKDDDRANIRWKVTAIRTENQ